MLRSLLAIASLFLLTVLLSQLAGSCKKEQTTRNLVKLELEVPQGFPPPVYRFEDNPLSREGFELGRKLFYDTLLSADHKISCGSCHQQIAAFGTYEHDRSHGVFDSHTTRNAPVLFNLAWAPAFHWDGEFSRLTDEIAQPLNGHIEMGMDYQRIINYLEKDPYYKAQFEKVFHYPMIRPEFVLKALAQFTGFFVSANSRYDRYKKGTVNFTAQEINGYNLYKANCASCHPEPLFTDYSFRNIGLPIDNDLQDFGRMRLTGNPSDSLKFKVPTLRNCYVSSNYMHDGRFNTLHQCIAHYRFGIQQSPTLDPSVRNGITLTNAQATDLFEFLRTLTDSSFLRDPRFGQ